MKNPTAAALIAIAVIVIIICYYAAYLASPPPKYDRLAQCLTEKGTIMYGTEGCHACVYQEQLLGPSFKYINHIDCLANSQICESQMITATPTWLINGTFYANVLAPEQLANISGCQI